MSYYEINKEKIRNYQKLYYEKNKDKLKETKKEYLAQAYQENRKQLLEYQKNYQKKNKEKYNTYQRNYYYVRKEKPDYEEKSKIYKTRYYTKVNSTKREQKCIKRTKKLMTKLFRELLKKVPLYLEPEPEVEEEPVFESTPFAGVKLSSKGFFILDW